jgi:hypothetical protein
LKASGIIADFQGILRHHSGLHCLKDSAIDLAAFEEGLIIGRRDPVLTQGYRRWVNWVLAVVKSISFSPLLKRRQIETGIENLLNLRHSLIAPLIGFVFAIESGGRQELKPVRLHAPGGSLADVL